MYYNDEVYKDRDNTMNLAIRKVLITAWNFVTTLVLTIAFTIGYLVITPVRVYEYIRELVELERVSQSEEQIRFEEMKRNFNH